MILLSVPGYLPGYSVLGYDSFFPFVTPYPTEPVPVGDLKVTTLLGWQLSAFRTLFCSFPNTFWISILVSLCCLSINSKIMRFYLIILWTRLLWERSNCYQLILYSGLAYSHLWLSSGNDLSFSMSLFKFSISLLYLYWSAPQINWIIWFTSIDIRDAQMLEHITRTCWDIEYTLGINEHILIEIKLMINSWCFSFLLSLIFRFPWYFKLVL